MRKPIIAGNWKMNNTMADTKEFIAKIKDFSFDGVELVLCVPFTDLIVLNNYCNDRIKIGSQNIHWEEAGAFTGEISPLMLKELNVEYAIIGHSERRELFAETDATVNLKVHTCFKHRINPIICVGEKLAEREKGQTLQIVKLQTEKAIMNLTSAQVKNIVIAYEPIWAIGTGQSSSAEDADNIIGFIRETIANQYDRQTANEVRIQYGGSVNPDNIAEFISKSEIDGVLVGGASVKTESLKLLVERTVNYYRSELNV